MNVFQIILPGLGAFLVPFRSLSLLCPKPVEVACYRCVQLHERGCK